MFLDEGYYFLAKKLDVDRARMFKCFEGYCFDFFRFFKGLEGNCLRYWYGFDVFKFCPWGVRFRMVLQGSFLQFLSFTESISGFWRFLCMGWLSGFLRS